LHLKLAQLRKGTDYFEILMPLYQTIRHEPDIVVCLWKVEETEEALLRDIQLSPNSVERYKGMRSEVHRCGFLSIRHLLKIAGYSDFQLHYDSKGKPWLEDGKHISISHSFNFTGIILSRSYEVGIDIELQRPKILRIAERFIAPDEGIPFADEQLKIQFLTKIWCAKESIYKIMSVPGLSFSQQILVNSASEGPNPLTARVLLKEKVEGFDVFFNEFEGYTLGWARKMNDEI
jgi:4'-phosphopantetheinyl transferase EntD